MIECVSPVAPPPPLNPEALAARLIAAANYTENTVRLFTDWASVFKRNHYNTLPHADQAMYQVAGGDPNITYYHGYWEIAEDEAMVIECDRPTCEFWNFQVDNYWMESLDYDKHRIHINGYGVEYTADDRVVIVVAHRDPGHPNWLTTAGHTLGTNLFRLIGAENPPAQISTRIVKFNDLVRELSK
jgi:hypothetical protein